MPMLTDVGTCLVPIRSGGTKASGNWRSDLRGPGNVTVGQHDHEFIAAQTS